MNEIFTSKWFQIIGVTIITSILGIFVKYVSRNDSHSSGFIKEDVAIGLELIITAFILLITDSVNSYNKLNDSKIPEEVKIILQNNLQLVPWLLLVFFVGLWGTSTVIRKLGWENANSLKVGWGIVFPNLIGLASIVYVFTILARTS